MEWWILEVAAFVNVALMENAHSAQLYTLFAWVSYHGENRVDSREMGGRRDGNSNHVVCCA